MSTTSADDATPAQPPQADDDWVKRNLARLSAVDERSENDKGAANNQLAS
jgi:hypothetical protein